jgi:hypothetical protein
MVAVVDILWCHPGHQASRALEYDSVVEHLHKDWNRPKQIGPVNASVYQQFIPRITRVLLDSYKLATLKGRKFFQIRINKRRRISYYRYDIAFSVELSIYCVRLEPKKSDGKSSPNFNSNC